MMRQIGFAQKEVGDYYRTGLVVLRRQAVMASN